MKKLKISFLWHQHQPYYRIDNEFILPWVLLHGTKDYFDIPEVLYEFPDIKQTFNFAPSLSLQIDEYISGKTKDKVQSLTAKPAAMLSFDDKTEIIKLFFHANYQNMIEANQRYLELFNIKNNSDFELNHFSENDWRDLQVWYNLVWFGYFSSQSGIIKRLYQKGRDFTEADKYSLLDYQMEVLKRINFQYKKLKELGQIDISCSPMFHPILPLLINSASARESRPNNKLPNPIFNFSDDAQLQISKGIQYFESVFGEVPIGMWPSEGSISDDTLELMIKNGIKWVATDEQILKNSKNNDYIDTLKFFPHKFKNNSGYISILFRDHFLSDRIGFEYSKWNEHDAANDFIGHLRNIKNEIAKNHGEESLEHACISVILDGENCWEYYKENGIPFLRALFTKLEKSDEFVTVTCTEAIINGHSDYMPELNHIQAGSWINGNFDIWIGHHEDINAWSLLSKARHQLDSLKNTISNEAYNSALNHLLIAEGSDWFWWYGPEHSTPNKPDFDRLFRHYIKNAYFSMNCRIPDELEIPIYNISSLSNFTVPKSKITNRYNLMSENYINENDGLIELVPEMSSMHQIGDFADSLTYNNDDEYLVLRVDYLSKLDFYYEFKLMFVSDNKQIIIKYDSQDINYINFELKKTETFFTLNIPLKSLTIIDDKVKIKIETIFKGTYLNYPAFDSYDLEILK